MIYFSSQMIRCATKGKKTRKANSWNEYVTDMFMIMFRTIPYNNVLVFMNMNPWIQSNFSCQTEHHQKVKNQCCYNSSITKTQLGQTLTNLYHNILSQDWIISYVNLGKKNDFAPFLQELFHKNMYQEQWGKGETIEWGKWS